MTTAMHGAIIGLCGAALCAAQPTWADVDPRTGRAGGDVAAQSFGELCQDTLPPDRSAEFYRQLERAEAALGDGDEETASLARGKAWQAAFRGGAESDMSVKCLGEAAAQRWFTLQLGLFRLQAEAESGRRAGIATLVVTAADQGTAALQQLVGAQPPGEFAASLSAMEDYAQRLDAEQQFGAFLLSGEAELRQAFRSALPPLRKQAAAAGRAALDAEEQAFNRSPTAEERAAAESVANAGLVATAMAGAAVDTREQSEIMVMRQRVNESRELLGEARAWNRAAGADPVQRPSAVRARQRGEQMLARADDTGLSLGARDEFYRDAEWYFQFGDAADQAATATARRTAIQPALTAERARQREAMDRAAADMEQRADAMQQSVEQMQKSDEERQRFKKEADALEEELGL